ncbi:MAG: hypothetical protein KBH36_04555 [Acidaminococcaceae bacterium]|nr:hypothetical protein [Acidaminococcaceae bacterium]
MKNTLPLIIILTLIPQLVSAEVILGFGIRALPTCGNLVASYDSKAELLTIEKNAKHFTYQTLRLLRKHKNQVIDDIYSKPLRTMNIEKSSPYGCRQYLAAHYQNIANALSENEKNQANKHYIPLDAVGYFIEIEKQLYPRFYGHEPFEDQLNKYAESDPELYRMLIDRFRKHN